MNKKYLIISIVSIIILIVLFLLFSQYTKIDSSQVEQSSLSSEIQMTQAEENSLAILTEDGILEQDELSEDDEQKIFQFEAYTGALPPYPNKLLNDATLLGIDVNENGVRDDVEHYIVDEYGEDKKVVEAFFAEAQLRQKKFIITLNKQFDKDTLDKLAMETTISVKCSSYEFRKSEFYESIDQFVEESVKISKILKSTKLRDFMSQGLSSKFHGYLSPKIKADDTICNEFYTSMNQYDFSQ